MKKKKELQKLEKSNFSFYTQGSNTTLDLIKLNPTSNKSDYYVLLVAHDSNGEITISEKPFKERKEIQFTAAAHPIFCLITSKDDDLKTTRTYFDKQVEKLAAKTEAISPQKNDLEFYFSTYNAIISETILNINQYYSNARNRSSALGLLVIDNREPYKPNIATFYEFSELEKLIQQRNELKTMKTDINGFIENLTDFPENAFIRENLVAKIDQTIKLITNNLEGKENFLLEEKSIKIIAKSFEKIKSIYSKKEAILDKNKQILSERENFIDQAITKLNRIKKELSEKINILANEVPLNIEKPIEEISTCIASLTEKKENIKRLTTVDYQALTSEYECFLEKINETSTKYSQKVDSTIQKRKETLSEEKHKLITGVKIKAFTEKLADEILPSFEQNAIYQEYSELVKKIDSTLRKNCIFYHEVEAIKKEITQLLPKIKQFKETILYKNKILVQSRYEEIQKILTRFIGIEKELSSFSEELVESVADEFIQDTVHSQLQELKTQVLAFKADCSSILNEKKLIAIQEKFTAFQTLLEKKKISAHKKSNDILKKKLLKIQQETKTLENLEFSKLVSRLEKQDTLTKKQIEAIENRLTLLKRAKINEIKEEIKILENEIETTAKKLHHATNESFNKENLKGQLSEITKKLDSLLEGDLQLINYPFDSISADFESFKRGYIDIKGNSEENSKKLIKEKLTTIQIKLTTQAPKNDALFGKVASLLATEEKLIESELKPVLIEFYSLKFQGTIESLENHVKKLQGQGSISLREKLLNFLFKTKTQEKLEIEQAINDSLKQIKDSIGTAFSSNDIQPLTDNLNELEGKLESPALTKHRSFLFFKFNQTTSGRLAEETEALLSELKTEFTS